MCVRFQGCLSKNNPKMITGRFLILVLHYASSLCRILRLRGVTLNHQFVAEISNCNILETIPSRVFLWGGGGGGGGEQRYS